MQVELHAVSKAYGSVRALDRVSLEITPGQVVAVLGANGAGKTTFLRLLAGIVGPDHGSVTLDGEPFRRNRLDQRQRLHFLPDFPPLFLHDTVLANLGLILKLFGRDGSGIEQTVLDRLEEFDLLPLADAVVGTLSRGQTYKVALTGLLVVDPELWLLDEPLASGMDPLGLSAFREHARDAVRRGRTVIYSTQVLEAVERFSDRVCLLHEGEVRAWLTTAELRERAAGTQEDPLDRLFRQLRESKDAR